MPLKYALTNEVLANRQREHADASQPLDLAKMMPKIFASDSTSSTTTKPLPVVKPVSADVRGGNVLRPRTLADMVGQEKLKPLIKRLIESSHITGRPLDHMLFVGASGTGKTTLATVIGNETGSDVYVLKAPVAMDMLEAVRQTVKDGDVVFVDEIHNQVSGDRRGLTQACDPESFYMLLEDGVLLTAAGPQDFPAVTWIGATTDVGLLPEPLSNRFPIQPRLSPYTVDEMRAIAESNALALSLRCDEGVSSLFAGAARCNPRQVNDYMKAASSLSCGRPVDLELAREVVEDLCSTTLDGLTESMQIVLRYLYRHCERISKGEVIYSASVNSLATAAGHGRDTKAISLLVEPWLLQRGLLQVRPTGRVLTPAGVIRARQLVGG